MFDNFYLPLFQSLVFIGGCILFSTIDYAISYNNLESIVKKQPTPSLIPKSKIIKKTLTNHFLITFPTILLFSATLFPSDDPISLSKILLSILYEEILFYHIHRLFHDTQLYFYHKEHHKLTSPIAIGVIYAHPLEHLLINVIPIVLSAKLANLNLMEAYLWSFIVSLSGFVSHSGYKFLSTDHDDHHLYHNVNYGVIGLCDYFYGTGKKK